MKSIRSYLLVLPILITFTAFSEKQPPNHHSNCLETPENLQLPQWLESSNIIATSFEHQCQQKKASLAAMYIPCSQGKKAIDYIGSFESPKKVRFKLDYSCAKPLATRQDVNNVLQLKLNLPEYTKLLAFTPFSVQYWEIPNTQYIGFGSDVSFTPKLGQENIWAKFKEEPIAIRLFGRESSWTPERPLFMVDGYIHYEAPHDFFLSVQSVSSLDKVGSKIALLKCQQSQEHSRCKDIF